MAERGGRLQIMRRQWRLLKHLSVNRYSTLATLSEHFKCCEKTIRRDVAVLEDVGFRVIRNGPHIRAFMETETE